MACCWSVQSSCLEPVMRSSGPPGAALTWGSVPPSSSEPIRSCSIRPHQHLGTAGSLVGYQILVAVHILVVKFSNLIGLHSAWASPSSSPPAVRLPVWSPGLQEFQPFGIRIQVDYTGAGATSPTGSSTLIYR